ncbi:hypothetical protein [Streptomyces ortus]|uniref:Uncharacterized protein n=1 Tax=Streptomyces ortus TaxID=2867268 RepID=A0ABT3V3E1_9ACTN|nr:hypothetical protein [Streptomyces ortus]MCX4234353.1 hypothetical protein [Streptomyces ortus]
MPDPDALADRGGRGARGSGVGALPTLPVRGAAPAAPFGLPPLSPEQLAADQPSLDMLRRVRRGLGALPEAD